MITDTHMEEIDKKQIILYSLYIPALDIVKLKAANVSATASSLIELLDQVYGSVQDGHELLVKVYITFPDHKDGSSTYLQKLYQMLLDACEAGGIDEGDIDHEYNLTVALMMSN